VHPVLFRIPAFDLWGRNVGPLTLHSYGVLLALAFLAGLWVVSRQARRAGMDAGKVSDLAIYVLIAGLVGAKLMLVVVEWKTYRQVGFDLVSILQSGGVFYGGLLGALPVAWLFARRHRLAGWATADVLAPGVVLGQAIGRLGCFAAGCCHGRPAQVPWVVTYHDVYAARSVGTPLDVPVHPSPIYESLACFLILGVLLWLAPRKRFHGQVLASYVVLYSAARFLIEYTRGDSSRGFLHLSASLVLSTSQVIALVLAILAIALVPYLLKTQRVAPAPGPLPAPENA
jgi:phosphatidylglycerol:prolipoprotein diacylglycerol transferase